jgi:hypothetical protein
MGAGRRSDKGKQRACRLQDVSDNTGMGVGEATRENSEPADNGEV